MTLGRTAERDITIAHPSVSGLHAAIDIVDLPEAGGKRVTLKVGVQLGSTARTRKKTGKILESPNSATSW